MLITLDQGSFLSALQAAQRASSTQSTLPILSGIKIQAEKDGDLEIYGTDLEISVKSKCPARVEKPGSTVLPGRLLVDIVKHMPPGAIEIKTEEKANNIEIKSEKSSFKIKGMQPEDFPAFPDVEAKQKITVDVRQLTDMLKGTAKAISKDETRPVLTGALLQEEDKSLLMVATDSYRLAVKTVPMRTKKTENTSLLIPQRAIEEIQKLLINESGKIDITSDENLMAIKTANIELISRLIEGQFPKYKQLVPKETTTSAEVNKDELIAAVKRVALMAQKNMSIKVSTDSSSINIVATTQGVGEASERVKAKITGEKMGEIAFNAQFLIDGLQAISEEKALFEFTGPVNPGLIKSIKKKDYLYLLMPIRIS